MVRVSGLVAMLALWSGHALAWTGMVDWPTFYRAGPAKTYAVLEEMQRGMTVDVLSCEGEWCRVQNGRSIGYLEASALAPQTPAPAPAATNPATPVECFDSRAAGYGKGEVFRYCPQPGR